jgi:hypothetical protein
MLGAILRKRGAVASANCVTTVNASCMTVFPSQKLCRLQRRAADDLDLTAGRRPEQSAVFAAEL